MKRMIFSFHLCLILVFGLSVYAMADTSVVGIMPGQPYSEELSAVMENNLQQHIWKLATNHNLSFEETNLYYSAMIGLAEAESNFNTKAYNKNKDGSVDRGIYQINSCNIPRLKRMGFIDSYEDLYDPYKCAVCADYLFYDGWERYGYSQKSYGYYLYGKDHSENKYTLRAFNLFERWRKILYGVKQ